MAAAIQAHKLDFTTNQTNKMHLRIFYCANPAPTYSSRIRIVNHELISVVDSDGKKVHLRIGEQKCVLAGSEETD